MILKNVSLLNFNKLPSKVINSNLSILKILNNAPIISNINNEDIVIGFVKDSQIINGAYFGDIYIHPEYCINIKTIEVVSQEFNIEKIIQNNIFINNIIIHVILKYN